MDSKSIFNITVCSLGIVIFIIHIFNLVLKRNKRRDEKILLSFFAFTAFHFAIYLAFTFIKEVYTSNPFIIAFYTSFYVMNNMEVFLLFYYLIYYANIESKLKKITTLTNILVFSIFVILDIINIFTHMFFYAEDGIYTRSKLMILSQGYQFIMFGMIFVLALINKDLKLRQKLAFLTYCLLPAISIIVQNLLPGYAISYTVIIITAEILVLYLSVEKNAIIEEEEKKTKEAYIKVMMSQIQPHFVYNTLSSISTLITLDPNKAKVALDEFTEYLRMNISTLTNNRLINFEDELKHIETYVSLEKMRFSDRLNVTYDIKVKDFELPPLTIQPLVENAIKHGILKKVEGGSITLKTYKEDNVIYVEVKDDGVGFNIDDIDFKNDKHFGINNIKHRLTSMCHADISIESNPNKGTKVVVKFYK